MAVIAVSRSFLISLHSQSSRLLVSCWAKNRHASSGPVRYVPGSHSQEKEGPRPSQLDASATKDPILMSTRRWKEEKNDLYDSNLQQNPFDAECWNVKQSNMCELSVEESWDLNDSADTNLEFMSTDTDESELILEEEQNADDNLIVKCSELDFKKTRQDVENLAIELLAGRAFTALELRKKLHGKRYPLHIIDSVIADVKCKGLLNDDLYAESFSRSRWLTANWGPRRIKQALVQKGVSETVANKATKQVFEEDNPDMSNQDMLHGMSKSSMDRLFVQASKQWLRGQDASPEKQKARIIRWLQYRGFSWGVTSFILKELLSQFPP
ncbi:putative regulatory protein RecX [Dioscorea sansibarensis]